MTRRRPDPAAGLKFWQLAFGKPPAPDKKKAAHLGQGAAARKTFTQPNYTAPRRARQRGEVDAVLVVHLVLAVVMALLAAGVLQ